ncbi:MAG: serine/threonine protein kinase, partial [Anaerolineales bacterium]|nr:serine/threonine protein kinase [Anaerolineales bacterium]
MSSLIGQQIDRYRVLAHIDRGGMADVYLAEDVDLQRAVALKVMLDTLTADEQFVQRFRREAQMVARLDHPNIVQVYRTGVTDDNRPYIAMQYIDGGSLRDRLRHFAAENQLVPTAQALAIVRQVAVALGVAHAAGIIHRDLKPGNVLLKENGTPVLVDLGIAAVQGGARLTSTGNLIGTPHYMSPEQVRGLRLDGRSDLYSLGVILYELLSGERPFEASESVAVLHQHVYEPPPALMDRRPDLTPQTLHLVEKALAKAPERRYATAAEMVADVDAALLAESGGAPLRPTTVWLPEPQARDLLPRSEVISRQTPAAAVGDAPGEAVGPAGRRRGGLWAGLALLLLAGAAVAFVLWG